jgi:hypothetical protein
VKDATRSKMKKKPLKVYWAPVFDRDTEDYTFLFNKPETVFNNLLKLKNKDNMDETIFACPAFANMYKRMLTFSNTVDSEYEYDFSNGKKHISKNGDVAIPIVSTRPFVYNYGPNFIMPLTTIFFAEEPLKARLTPPYLHNSEFLKYGTIMSGEYDIGQWFRPFSFELQVWKDKGIIRFNENDALMYIEFFTDRPIELIRFNMSKELVELMKSVTTSRMVFGRSTLAKKYERFKNIGMREKVLTEINKNLIDENPMVIR